MQHYTPRSVRGTVLFRDWEEARRLWDAVVRHVAGLRAAVLMPDHLHILAGEEGHRGVARAMRAYARVRNRLRGEEGAAWSHEPYVSKVSNRDHLRRTVRYIYLNPVRAGLVDDPLAWPFSTLRDALGLALVPVRPAVARPDWLLDYVSRDADAGLAGSPWPEPPASPPRPEEVLAAVSSLGRYPVGRVRRRGPARSLFLAACRVHAAGGADEIARLAGVSEVTVYRAPAGTGPDVARVFRVCGDPRFFALAPGDLRERWRRYAGRR